MSPAYVLRNVAFVGPMAYFRKERAERVGNPPICPSCDGPLGMRVWLAPKRCTFGKGTRTSDAGDLVFGATGPFLASQAFVEAWEREGLTGVDRWDPVTVVGQPAGRWLHPVLPAPTVRADHRRMHFTWKREPVCDVCQSGYFARFEGVAIEPESWSGQALFELINLPGSILVSDGFRRWAEEEAFDNIELVPCQEAGYDELGGELRQAPDGSWHEVRRVR